VSIGSVRHYTSVDPLDGTREERVKTSASKRWLGLRVIPTAYNTVFVLAYGAGIVSYLVLIGFRTTVGNKGKEHHSSFSGSSF